MTLSREAMLEVMAYADGEVDDDARARVEELLRTSEEARGVLDAMGALGDVVREGAEAESGAAGSAAADAIADGVMAAIAREPGAQAKVASIAEARKARGGMATAAIAVLALAAGAFFFLRSNAPAPTAGNGAIEPAPSIQVAPPSSTEAPAPTAAAAVVAQVDEAHEQGVDLEEAQSTKNKVNVFFVPSTASAGAVASVVVWIDDRHGGH